jgi:hypothetical protein
MEPGPQGLGSQGLRGGGGGGIGTRGAGGGLYTANNFYIFWYCAGGGLYASITFSFFVILPIFFCFLAQLLEES